MCLCLVALHIPREASLPTLAFLCVPWKPAFMGGGHQGTYLGNGGWGC